MKRYMIGVVVVLVCAVAVLGKTTTPVQNNNSATKQQQAAQASANATQARASYQQHENEPLDVVYTFDPAKCVETMMLHLPDGYVAYQGAVYCVVALPQRGGFNAVEAACRKASCKIVTANSSVNRLELFSLMTPKGQAFVYKTGNKPATLSNAEALLDATNATLNCAVVSTPTVSDAKGLKACQALLATNSMTVVTSPNWKTWKPIAATTQQ